MSLTSDKKHSLAQLGSGSGFLILRNEADQKANRKEYRGRTLLRELHPLKTFKVEHCIC
jgi:hypothetical protein